MSASTEGWRVWACPARGHQRPIGVGEGPGLHTHALQPLGSRQETRNRWEQVWTVWPWDTRCPDCSRAPGQPALTARSRRPAWAREGGTHFLAAQVLERWSAHDVYCFASAEPAAQPGPWKAPAPRATINNTSYLQVPVHRLRDGVRVQGCLPGVQVHSREALRLSDHVGDGTAKSMCRKCVSITFQDAESKAAVSQVRSGWCGAGPGPAG